MWGERNREWANIHNSYLLSRYCNNCTAIIAMDMTTRIEASDPINQLARNSYSLLFFIYLVYAPRGKLHFMDGMNCPVIMASMYAVSEFWMYLCIAKNVSSVYLWHWNKWRLSLVSLRDNFSSFEFWRQKYSPYQKKICQSLLDTWRYIS